MKSKAQKGMEALERQEVYDALTLKEKLARLDLRGHVAKRERARLNRKNLMAQCVRGIYAGSVFLTEVGF